MESIITTVQHSESGFALIFSCTVCLASALNVIYSGFESKLFLGSLIWREGGEKLSECVCQGQFVLAYVGFLKHVLINRNQTFQFLNGMLENYLQANKVA